MLEPTDRLLELVERFQAPMTFFVDAGYLWKIAELSHKHPELHDAHQRIEKQLKSIEKSGSDIQLHIHPHWELTEYTAGKWQIPQSEGYRLAEFSREEACEIFMKYKNHLDALLNRKTIAYRAGGWCIQPFEHIKSVFDKSGLIYDSSVVPGMVFNGGVYSLDFSSAPHDLDFWSFDSNPCQNEINGKFIEVPISAMRYSPLFYWELYVRGKLNRKKHQFFGDGNFIPQPGRKWQTLTKSQWNHASCDGFYASKMSRITQQFKKNGRKHLMFIGHPKGMTMYSFDRLSHFLEQMRNTVQFQTFSQFHDQNS